MQGRFERSIERYADIYSREFPEESRKLASSVIEQVLLDVRGIVLSEGQLSQGECFKNMRSDIIEYVKHAAKCKEPMNALQLLRDNPEIIGLPAFSRLVTSIVKTQFKKRPYSMKALKELFERAYADPKTAILIEHRVLRVNSVAAVQENLRSVIGYRGSANGHTFAGTYPPRFDSPGDSRISD